MIYQDFYLIMIKRQLLIFYFMPQKRSKINFNQKDMLTTEEMLKKNIGSKTNTLWLTGGCGINQLETERGLQVVVLVLIQYSSHVLLDFVLLFLHVFILWSAARA